MASSPEEIQKHVRFYWMIGITLFGCSTITLALGIWAPFDFGAPGVSGSDIVVGLLVAAIKSSLVMLIFMHLSNERGLIYKTLVFTLAFAISLMGLTLFAQSDPIPEHVSVYQKVEYAESDPTADRDHDDRRVRRWLHGTRCRDRLLDGRHGLDGQLLRYLLVADGELDRPPGFDSRKIEALIQRVVQ